MLHTHTHTQTLFGVNTHSCFSAQHISFKVVVVVVGFFFSSSHWKCFQIQPQKAFSLNLKFARLVYHEWNHKKVPGSQKKKDIG